MSRSNFVYQHLLNAILDGRLRGKPIREADIANRLRVSRTPVRAALQRLQDRGLLAAAGRSLVVASLTEREALELYAMREALEGTAARLAAERATAEDIVILNRMHDAYVAGQGDDRRAMQLNWRFHRALHEAAHNRYLIQAIDGVYDAMLLLQSATFRQSTQRELADVQHRRIIAAIEKRDPDAAESAAREHIRTAALTHYENLLNDPPAAFRAGDSLSGEFIR